MNAERDHRLLMFLWRWKISTTAALHRKFFSTCSVARAYNRLYDLERSGVIQTRRDPHDGKYVWGLTKLGFQLIRDRLPALRAETFRSENIAHDLLTSAIQLGDWFLSKPSGCEIFSEQQLRSYHPEMYPVWVPKDTDHRPDGYWKAVSGNTSIVVALEVELSPKAQAAYTSLQDFYNFHEGIANVLWVVSSTGLGQRIEKILNVETREDGSPHSFITLGGYLQDGWNARIEHGKDQGKSIAELLRTQPVLGQFPGTVSPILEVRKSPHKSKTSKIITPGDFRY